MYLDPKVLAAVGKAATVHAVLAAHDTGNGVEMTAKQIAVEATVSEKTVRRHIKTLCDAGFLKSEKVIQDRWQKANRYYVTTPRHHVTPSGHNDQTPGQDGQAIEVLISTNSYKEEDNIESYLSTTGLGVAASATARLDEEPAGPLHEQDIAWTSMDRQAAIMPVVGKNDRLENPGGPAEVFWPRVDDPMPVNTGQPRVWESMLQARWYVVQFERHILAMHNEERLVAGKAEVARIPRAEERRSAWLKSATVLLKRFVLEDIYSVTDYLFNDLKGQLPWNPVNGRLRRPRPDPKLRKVTHVQHIVENYARLKDYRAAHPGPVSSDQVPVASETRLRTQASDIADLVARFQQYRNIPALDDFDEINWSKTFKIMLKSDGRTPADIRLVIEALANPAHSGFIDTGRYLTPFDVRREFDLLLDLVSTVNAVLKHKDSSPVSPIRKVEKVGPAASEAAKLRTSAQDHGSSSDMSDFEERRARYDRAAQAKWGSAAILTSSVC